MLYDFHRFPSIALPRLLVARTGRHNERSSEFPTAKAAARTPRLVPAFLDLGPMRNVLFWQNPEADGLLALRGYVSFFHTVQHASRLVVVYSVGHSGASDAETDAAGASNSSTSTSQPLDRGIPVPSVY